MPKQMTFKQWKRSLGEALSLADAAAALGKPALVLAKAAARRELVVHRFAAADGRAYFMVRVDDLLDWHRRATPVKLTPSMMGRAFARMMAGGRAGR